MLRLLTAGFTETGRQRAMAGLRLALIASVILVGISELTDTYRLTVESGTDSEYASEQAKQIELETLEPDGRATVVTAIESENVWTARPVSQFGYPLGAITGGQWHLVEYQDQQYVLTAVLVATSLAMWLGFLLAW